MSLKTYDKKRDFRRTPEPRGKRSGRRRGAGLRFVIQKHDASRLHYDFRLELDGAYKSWAVPKGPSVDPGTKRLAVHVEDHPLEYGEFEGVIPEGSYGAGTVMIWDRGMWEPADDPREGYERGKLSFTLDGEKLHGEWALIRTGGRRGDDDQNWLLIKADDAAASGKRKDDPLEQQPKSVATGRTLDEIAAEENEAGGGGSSGKRGGRPRGSGKRGAGTSGTGRYGRGKGSKASQGETKADRKRARVEAKLRDVGDADEDREKALDELDRIEGVTKGKTPAKFSPQLATLSREIPRGDEWLYEVKFDGYRVCAVRRGGRWRLITRRGKDWTDRFQPIADALEDSVRLEEGILDGEVVVLKADGTSDFQALQNALNERNVGRLCYYVFDLPHVNGYDLTGVPLLQRKQLLHSLLPAEHKRIRYSSFLEGGGEALLQHACRFALEGLIAKRKDAGYSQSRTKSWLKLKCSNRQEFVVVGFTEPKGARQGLGALLVGVHEGDTLRYSGKVGTGFDDETLKRLREQLSKLERKRPAVEDVPRADARGAHWVKPELVAEVEFSEWTTDDRLRHPVFHGLREDKQAEEVRRENSGASAARHSNGKSKGDGGGGRRKGGEQRDRAGGGKSRRNGGKQDEVSVAGVRLTHPERVVYPEQGTTKRELAEYYERIAEWCVPVMVERPLSVVRCPSGREGQCFYQKHVSESLGPAIHGISVKEKKGKAEYLYVKDLEGIITLVQFGVLEIHPWGSRVDRYEKPDRIIFDLDPDAAVDFADTVAAARLVGERLAAFDLKSFVKTTGGKGLHVVVPIQRRNTWDEVKAFSGGIARGIAQADPGRYVATMSKEKRKNRVFIDYLRNSQGATSVAAYSTRARPNAPVSVPVRWDELTAELTPNGYTVANLPQRLDSLKDDPWTGFDDVRQSITKGMLRDVEGG